MKRPSISAGLCLLALFILTFSLFAPILAGQETHPCVEVYVRCALVALSSNLSFRQTAEWLQACNAMYISCMVFFYLAPVF